MLLDGWDRRDAVGSKAIVQQRDVLDVWDCVGAAEAITRRGVTWTTARTFHQDRELFNVTFTDTGHSPFPPFVNISQAETEQILDDRIAEQPLIGLRWGHTVTGLDQDAAGLTVTCQTSAGRTTVRGPYAIVCTGAHSDDLRRQLGLRFDGESFDDRFLICDVRVHLPGWETERRFYFDSPLTTPDPRRPSPDGHPVAPHRSRHPGSLSPTSASPSKATAASDNWRERLYPCCSGPMCYPRSWRHGHRLRLPVLRARPDQITAIHASRP